MRFAGNARSGGYRLYPLREAFLQDPEKAKEVLRQFYRYARNLVLPKVDSFEWVLKSGASNEARTSLDDCDFLRVGRTDYLETSTSHVHLSDG